MAGGAGALPGGPACRLRPSLCPHTCCSLGLQRPSPPASAWWAHTHPSDLSHNGPPGEPSLVPGLWCLLNTNSRDECLSPGTDAWAARLPLPLHSGRLPGPACTPPSPPRLGGRPGWRGSPGAERQLKGGLHPRVSLLSGIKVLSCCHPMSANNYFTSFIRISGCLQLEGKSRARRSNPLI